MPVTPTTTAQWLALIAELTAQYTAERQLADAATAGDWTGRYVDGAQFEVPGVDSAQRSSHGLEYQFVCACRAADTGGYEDACFIAAARSIVPRDVVAILWHLAQHAEAERVSARMAESAAYNGERDLNKFGRPELAYMRQLTMQLAQKREGETPCPK